MNSAYQWKIEEQGVFTLYHHESPVLSASAQGVENETGIIIDSRKARLLEEKTAGNNIILTYQNDSGLVLKEILGVSDGAATVQCSLSMSDGRTVKTNSLTPLVAHGKGDIPYLWRDLGAKMLLVPYDNDMWMRYEAVAMRAGRKSYDVTVLYLEEGHEALLIGAMDFDRWKNAVACPGTDARTLEARCGQGACDEGSHDVHTHGTVEGQEVFSSRFMILDGSDYRDLLEHYADALHTERKIRTWDGGVPFGFNSWAGLGFSLNAENLKTSGDFIYQELHVNGFEHHGKTFVNMDSGWQSIPENVMLQIKDDLHERGQLAGIYDVPFACFASDLDQELPFMPGHSYAEIVLRDSEGQPCSRVDGAVPYDVTHPLWKMYTEQKARHFIDWGYDYLKIDFLSHAGMEGEHYNPHIRTGREALTYGYSVLEELYDEKKIGRPFFLSLSIAPLFPHGYGNARRFSCDAFGLSEDVEYVLNAQTYSWWTGGRLYQFNDPDHIVLHRSFCMPEDATEGEARARYTSAVIAGSVMLLSEDYGKPGARERTAKIAGNQAVNAVAKSGVVFRPTSSAGGSASHSYTAVIDGVPYVAIFAWNQKPETVTVDIKRAGLPDGTYQDLWTDRLVSTVSNALVWDFENTDAALLRLV